MTRLLSAVAMIALLFYWGCDSSSKKQENPDNPPAEKSSGPPFSIQVKEYVNPNLPGLHSYTHAHYQDKLIMFGGRIDGLHNDYNFDLTYANKSIYVIDTKNFGDPTTWTVHQAPVTIVKGLEESGQFLANNAQYFQEGNVLYVVGGMLYANVPTFLEGDRGGKFQLKLKLQAKTQDGKAARGPMTLPYMTAIDLEQLVEAVMNSGTLEPPHVRQVKNDDLAITGGEVATIGDSVYLTFGWNFSSSDEEYSHQVRSFAYTDDGSSLDISKINVCPTCWDGQSGDTTAGYFRRRDGAMDAIIDPADGQEALVWYGGVFKNGNTYFNDPVMAKPGSAKVIEDTLYWNIYTCRLINAYSKANKEMYASPLGGMTYVRYTGSPSSEPVKLSPANTEVISSQPRFGNIPLSNRFTTVLTRADGSMDQYLLPDSFPPIASPLVLPAIDTIPADTLPTGTVTYNGSESEIYWTLDASLMMRDAVVDYDAFVEKYPNGATVAYLHGGIESAQDNVFGLGNMTLHLSVASKRLFEVKIVPLK